jgi:hypothetical protein
MKSGVWKLFTVAVVTSAAIMYSSPVKAQDPVTEAIKAAVKKAIKAIDLQVQRLQNVTIRLQNVQKTVENTLSKLKLQEISNWVEKQRKLYADYYEELWKVKAAVMYYREVKSIVQKHVNLVDEYKRAYGLFQQDKHFTPDEINYIGDVYAGMLEESLHNIDQLMLVVNSFTTQMSDAKRMELIESASAKIDKNLDDLYRFNNSNAMLSLRRAKDQQEIDIVKAMYGLQ